MTGVGHVPPLEAGELRRAAGRVEVIDAGLHQRVPGGRAREPQRGVGVLVPSHRATRFRCASGNGKARSRGCVFPLGDGRVEGDARPRSATLRAKAMRFTRCSAADTRVRVAVAVVGVARDVQCESGRARSPFVSCRELSSRVPRRIFSAISQTAIFYKEPLRMGNHPDDTRAEPRENKRRFATRAFRVPEIAPALLPGARVRVFCHVRVEISQRESRT